MHSLADCSGSPSGSPPTPSIYSPSPLAHIRSDRSPSPSRAPRVPCRTAPSNNLQGKPSTLSCWAQGEDLDRAALSPCRTAIDVPFRSRSRATALYSQQAVARVQPTRRRCPGRRCTFPRSCPRPTRTASRAFACQSAGLTAHSASSGTPTIVQPSGTPPSSTPSTV